MNNITLPKWDRREIDCVYESVVLGIKMCVHI